MFSRSVMQGQLDGAILLVCIPLSQYKCARLFSKTFDELYL